VVLAFVSTPALAGEDSVNEADANITREAAALMLDFARRTGLEGDRTPRRYLWTDAFAVCNFLGLARETGERRYRELALRLVEQVHRTLGRHRGDDSRRGWISGLGEEEGAAHPTRGGLRIGKALPERGVSDPFDDRLEWERDGQYFHYLTKWMHALDQLSRATVDPRFNAWARELDARAYRAFTYLPEGSPARRMYWKMSIDLSRPLVPSMGQHDPLDGYVTSLQLRATAVMLANAPTGPDLGAETREFAAMTRASRLETSDPLGLGGLLVDAYRVAELMQQGAVSDRQLLARLLRAARGGVEAWVRGAERDEPAEYRLAFRELGLAIGLHAVERMAARRDVLGAEVGAPLDALLDHTRLAREIESFWRKDANRAGRGWSEHRDINEVMLATSLVPEGFLDIAAAD